MNTTRLPFLDGLRVAALALLIPYHVGMYYVSWDWHVKSAAASQALEPFMLLTAPWRLGLLFLVAGAACHDLFARRGLAGTVKDRSLRLLLPLIFGMAVIVPPQAYYEVLTKAPQLLPGDGGYLDFWAAYLQGGRYCRGQDCMTVPTWNHLWFVAYLWPYAVLGAGVAALWRRPLPAWVPRSWVWLLLPIVPLALARVAVFPSHPSTHNLTHDLYNHLQYGGLFALGWLSRTPLAATLWPAARRWRWAALGLALASWALLVAYFMHYADTPPPAAVLGAQRVLWAALSWWAILAACGWAQVVFERESPRLRAASAGVFCVYILHQTLIVLLTRALLPLNLPWGLEALLLIALTLGLSVAAYRVLARVPGLALLMGIQRRRTIGQLTTMPVTSSATSPALSAASTASSERSSRGERPGFQRT
jgi:surface polysaccharide O-acyltransferase-like enzyme